MRGIAGFIDGSGGSGGDTGLPWLELVIMEPAMAMWKEHIGGRDHQHLLCDILMLEAWRQRWEACALPKVT